MESLTINERLKMKYPEDFHVMDDEERAAYKTIGMGKSVCLKAPDLHMVVSIGWRKAGGFLTRLFVGSDLVKNMESCYKRSMRPYGYTMDEYIQSRVGGEKADGLRYHYRAQGVEMTAESVALEKDGSVYYFHVYYRTEVAAESSEIWNRILSGAEWR